MGTEIERKFLVRSDSWRQGAIAAQLRQGYLSKHPQRTVRVRLVERQGFLTIKGATEGLTRMEFEYAIPFEDAEALLSLCDGLLVEKTRYVVMYAGNRWEVDEFHGENQGLVVAELELTSEEGSIEMPPWIGIEVSHDMRYSNSNLTTTPYSRWLPASA